MRINPHLRRHQIGELSLLVSVDNTRLGVFVLNKAANAICDLYETGKDQDDIAATLHTQFSAVPLSKLQEDVQSTLTQLRELHFRLGHSVNEPDLEAVLRAYAKQSHTPVEGSLEITFKCNLRCVHCYCINCKWVDRELSTQEIYSAIDQMVGAGCLWLLLTGGDPLVRRDFKPIYRYAVAKGLIVTVFTNGLLIDEELCELFKDLPPFVLEMSLYGMSNETYYRVTGHRNGFKKFKTTCDLLDKSGIQYKLKAMIQKHNQNELTALRAFAKERCVSFRYDAEVHARLDGQDVGPSIRLTPQEIIEVEISEDSAAAVNAWIDSREERRHLYDTELFFCAAGKTSFNIDPFGNVSLCGRVRKPAFSLRQMSFAKAWEELAAAARMGVPRQMPCTSCKFIQFCKSCPAVLGMPQDLRDKEFCNIARQRAMTMRDLVPELTSNN